MYFVEGLIVLLQVHVYSNFYYCFYHHVVVFVQMEGIIMHTHLHVGQMRDGNEFYEYICSIVSHKILNMYMYVLHLVLG